MSDWLLVGLIGWVILCVYRIFTTGLPKSSFLSYIRGLLLAAISGPFCFVIIAFIVYKGTKRGKASSKQPRD